MWANLKIRTGLLIALAAFVVKSVVAIGLGGNSSRQAGFVDELSDVGIRQNTLLKNAYIAALRATIRSGIMFDALKGGDANGAAEQGRLATALLGQMNKFADEYKAIPMHTEDGRKQQAALVAAFQRYGSLMSDMLGKLSKGDMAGYEDLRNNALAGASGELGKRLDEYSAVIQNVSEQFISEYANTSHVMGIVYIGLLVGVVLVAVVMFAYMTSHVFRPMQRMIRLFDSMAAGDLTNRVEVHG
jgi:methyl-accepting chemotaxis protein-2 (aspartate sensor receptor)